MTTLPFNLDHPCYHDDEQARVMFEAIRWPYGPTCPHCGKLDTVAEHGGKKSMGPGWFWCSECRQNFTVRVGSVLERSHIAMHKWMLGFRLYGASKKGFSAHQLMRTLSLGSYRSAWFMAHRIREAMDGSADADGPLGGEGKIVEADEAFIGRINDGTWVFVNDYGWVRTKRPEKMKVMTLVERGGRARSVKVDDLTSDTLRAVLVTNASRKSVLHTDDFRAYAAPGREFADHETVNHSAKEYVRTGRRGRKVTTNTVEGYFSIFKRGMIGVYQHCSEKHLPRYLSEFDFRYSNRAALGVNDTERSERAIKGAVGRRLTYKQPGQRAHV
jgi:transposase-like protein